MIQLQQLPGLEPPPPLPRPAISFPPQKCNSRALLLSKKKKKKIFVLEWEKKPKQELAKNIDIDGDGEIEPDEKEILDTLRSMDVDGDGTISLRELVNLGAKLNQQREQAQFYKRVAFGVMIIAVLAICAVFLACFAAVEAAKDSRPGGDGVMKTVVTGKDPKVVATAGYTQSIGLTSLHTATFATLRGIKDIGFKVGNRFYQYTVTGFEQDIVADGSTTVRLFTSRGDSIYVSKTKANLERVQGNQVIDISAAAVQNRKLLAELSEDHRRQLLFDTTGVSDGSGNVVTESAGSDIMYDPMVMQSLYTTSGDAGTPSYSEFITTAECPKTFSHNGDGGCECKDGFYMGKADYNSESGKWEITKDCVKYPTPEGVGQRVDESEKEATTYCPLTNKAVTLESDYDEATNTTTYYWEYPDGGTKCELPEVPKNHKFIMKKKEVDHSMIAGSTTPNMKEVKFEYTVKCAIGFYSYSPTGPTYDHVTDQWIDLCIKAPLPPNTRRVPKTGSSDQITGLKCVEGTYQEAPYRWFSGFPWSPQGRWISHTDMLHENKTFNEVKLQWPSTKDEPDRTVVFPAQEKSSECKYKQPGYKYVCDASGGCEPTRVFVQGTNASKVNYTVHDYDGNPYVTATCAPGYYGTVDWNPNPPASWTVSCQGNMPYCPPETLKLTGTEKCACDPATHKGPGYEFKKYAQPKFDTMMNMYVVGEYSKKVDKNVVGCVKKSCPDKTVDRSITNTFLDCQCKYAVPGTDGQTKYNWTTHQWITTNCTSTPPYTCPTGSSLDAYGDCVCNAGTPNGYLYKEKQSMENCYAGYPGNNCYHKYIYNEHDWSYTEEKSAAYIQAEALAATEEWKWFGSCYA